MADIRINALATTAASTASDDFVAVDGSANGTRKLNAYSPTFGGNLTVSGTGTSSIGGNTKIGNPANANQRLVVDGAVAGVGAITTNTGLSGGYLYSDGGTGGVVAAWNGGNYSALSILGSTVTIGTGASGTTAATISSSGNVLIGTNVDSSALLQVGTNTTTAAGGMKFGTDTSLYRSAAGQLRGPSSFIDATFASSGLFFGASMTLQANDNVLIKTNGSVTALTLDSSQNATFAGTVTAQSTGTHTFGTTNTVTMAAGVLTAKAAVVSLDYVQCGATGAFNLGNPTTDGSWRIVISGVNLLIQKRESGSWVTKQTITP
jgi:hypothetical protein